MRRGAWKTEKPQTQSRKVLTLAYTAMCCAVSLQFRLLLSGCHSMEAVEACGQHEAKRSQMPQDRDAMNTEVNLDCVVVYLSTFFFYLSECLKYTLYPLLWSKSFRKRLKSSKTVSKTARKPLTCKPHAVNRLFSQISNCANLHCKYIKEKFV